MKELEEITISMKEYKELLIIKGKYEELKSQKTIFPVSPIEYPLTGTKYPITTYKSCEPLPESDVKVTFNK